MTDFIGLPVTDCDSSAPAGLGPHQKVYTWLSLTRYARLLGIIPPHFWTGAGETTFPASGGGCEHLWWLYDWQNSDAVGRDTLTWTIHQAEREIAQIVGFPLAPEWVSEEIVYPQKYYRKDYYSSPYDVQGRKKPFRTKWRKIIATGRRALTLIGTATMVGGTITLHDLDSDGFNETLRITLPTTLTTTSEIKVYYNGYSGARGWELRTPRRKVISGGNVIIDYYVWQCIEPSKWEVFLSTTELSPVNLDNTTNFVTSLDVYREYTDTTEVSAQLYWDGTGPSCCNALPTATCTECEFTIQDGCLHIRDAVSGYVAGSPATYSDTDGEWIANAYSVCREPDFVKCWYQAGDLAPEFLNTESYDPLSHFWAQIIAWVATARLERPPCACSNVETVYNDLSAEMTKSITFETMNNPLGIHKGEVMAWKRIQSLGFDIKGASI